MILDTLSNAETYFDLHPGFAKAFAFLRRADLRALAPGEYPIEGDDLFAIIQKDRGKRTEDARLESHRDYIDIQFLIDGNERAGWRVRDECKEVEQAYSPEKDIELFLDTPSSYLSLQPDMFAVFFRGDAHAPMISDGSVHKCVVKVRAARR